jgi:hypothetical protein
LVLLFVGLLAVFGIVIECSGADRPSIVVGIAVCGFIGSIWYCY